MSLKNSTQKMFTTDETGYTGPRVAAAVGLNIMVRTPREFKDVQEYADALLNGSAVIINLELVEPVVRNRIFDYLNGVAYIINANVDVLGENGLIYSPAGVTIDKKDDEDGKGLNFWN